MVVKFRDRKQGNTSGNWHGWEEFAMDLRAKLYFESWIHAWSFWGATT